MPGPDNGTTGTTGGGHVAEDLFGDRDSDDEDPSATAAPLLESRKLATSSSTVDVQQESSDLQNVPEILNGADVMDVVEQGPLGEDRGLEDLTDFNKASYKRQRDE